jgi:hypothetical protein
MCRPWTTRRRPHSRSPVRLLGPDPAHGVHGHARGDHFTPSLTFELYVQPFIASAEYARYKEFAAPRELTKLVYGEDVGTIAARPGEPAGFVVDPDGIGPAESFEIDDPSFTLRSLRGNAVLRWEYRPGSTLFLVWTLDHQDALPDGDLDLTRDVQGVFNGPLENIFLVKLNYWFGF